jgi:hypothetical protein
MRARRRSLALAVLVAPCLACGAAEEDPTAAVVERSATAASKPRRLLADVTAESGIDFVHEHGGTGRKYLPEIMGAGGATLDYDGDGLLDLYLVQSGGLPWSDEAGTDGNRLFRNLGNGRFIDVSEASGAGDSGYGMGAIAFDFDADGASDLYVVNLGPDVLLRNNGDGTFSDVTAAAGIDSPLWGSSAAAFDADADGDLDLYIVNYLDFSEAKHVDCGTPSQGILSYCHPDVYRMAPDAYFRNRGDGTFEAAAAAAGLTDTTGKGLGVVAADLTDDGRVDIYVANDSTPNFLYRNLGDGEFEEVGLFTGVGYNEEGQTEAGMGTTCGDVNGDGRLDLFVTNLTGETNALYLGGQEFFYYSTREAGLHTPSFMPVGFGTDFVDFDNDRDLDLLVTNGHVIDNVELIDDAQTFRQPSQVFWNDGSGSFSPVSEEEIADLRVPRVGRGTITFDADNDGRPDVVVTFNGDRARLFHNQWRDGGRWLGIALAGAGGNRDGANARVSVEVSGVKRIEEKTIGSSYQTSSDPRLLFGLGAGDVAARVVVRFASGKRIELRELESGFYYRLFEPGGS